MNTNKKRRSRLAKVYTVKIREDITKMIERAHHCALAERPVTLQAAIEVANRDLRRTVEMHPDRRAFSALKAVSAHIALASNNKYTSASLSNSDLLPVGHPMSTALHAMTSSALAHAQARWIAADRLIADDARALVASAYSLTPDSFERKHAFARLAATPNTSVPRMLTLDPIIAVGGFGLGGDSSAARSMRAKLQRRDRYGKFAFMGGGFSYNLRGLNGAFSKFGGRVVGAGGDNAVEIEVKGHPTVPNGIYSLPAGKGVSSKAWLPESVEVTDSDSSTDLFVDESSLQRLDAPSGWDKQPTEPGAPELWTSKDGYFVTKDGDTLSLNRANSADNSIGEQVASSDSWADIQKAALGDQDDYEKALKEDEAFGPTKAKVPDSKVSTALKAGESPEGWTTEEIATTDGVATAWRHTSPDGQYFVTEDRNEGLGAKKNKAVEDRVPNFAVVRRNEDGTAGKTAGSFVNTWGGVDSRIKADSMQRAKEAPSAPEANADKHELRQRGDSNIYDYGSGVIVDGEGGITVQSNYNQSISTIDHPLPKLESIDDAKRAIEDWEANREDRSREKMSDAIGSMIKNNRDAKNNGKTGAQEWKSDTAKFISDFSAPVDAKKYRDAFAKLKERLDSGELSWADGLVEAEKLVPELTGKGSVPERTPQEWSDWANRRHFPGDTEGNKSIDDAAAKAAGSPEAPSAPDFISPEVGLTVLSDGLSKVESALGDIPEEDLDNLDEQDSEALNKVNDLLDSAQEAIDSIDPVGSDTNDLRFDQARADLGEIAEILSESNNGDMQNAGFDLKEKIDEFINLPQIDFGGGRAERASRETPASEPGEPPTAGPTLMPGDDGEPDDAGTRNLPSEQDYMDDPAIDAYIKSMDSYLAEEFDSMFETPDGAYKPDIFGAYEPKGKTIEDSADYTDDPEVLAGMFSDQELVLALRDAVLPLDGEDAPGRGALEFSDGPEFVSAEALYFAIDKKSGKGDMSLASIYDMELDPDREMTNADRIAMFEEDAKIDPLGGDEITMPTTRDAEVLRAVDRNKEIGKPTKAQVATDLMLSHKEQNQSIIDIADDLIAKQDDGLGYDSFNLQDTLVKYLPWSVSSDSDEREAFSALWGMMMSLDGGASTEELTPESLGDPEAFRTIIYNSLLDIHGGDDTIAMDSYNELIDNFGGMPEFVAGKESIASGKDDLGSGTTAAAFYRLVATSAKPNEKSIYRLVNVKNNDPLLEKYTTEGSLFGIDARSFTSTNIADGSLASSFFIPSDADDSRIIFEIAPGETKSIDASTISWFVGENEHFSFGNFEVVSVRKQKGRLKNDEYIVKIRSTDTKDVAAPTAEGISYSGIEDWKKVGGQMGSNVGGTFEDQDGNQYYVKIPKSPSHAQNESLASALYREAGIEAVEVNLGFSDGELRTISPLIPNSSTDLESRLDDAEYIKKLQEGFAVDAWLANWDVAGLTFDNVITDSNGEPVRVDPGGALMWRAQGAPKGKLFGDKVNEIDSLRDPDLNPTSAEVFGSMTDADISNSAAKLVGITPERIDSIVDSIVTDPNEAATLKERLKKRRNDILKRFAPKDNIFNENTPLPIEEDPNAPQPPSDPNDADAMSNYKDALADYEINKAVSDVWDCPPDGLTAAGDKTCTTPSVDELIDNVNSKADAVGVVDNSGTADKILDDIIDFVEQVQSEELKPSTKKKAKEIAEEIAAIREGLADGSITNDQAIARLNTLSDSIPVGGTSDDANTLEVIGETIDDYRRILDGSFEDRPFSPNYPPAGSGSKGYAKDKTTFLTLGMRVRNKWGYAGVVDRYDKNSWQVWVTMDIDPSGQFAPGYKKMSFSTKTLDVIPEGGDDSPWIDLPGTPEGKKPKTGVTPTKVPPKGSPGEKYSKEIADKIAKSGKAAKPPKAEAPSGAPEAPENLNYEIDTGTPKSETPSTISKAEKATGEYAKENPGSKIYTDSRGGQLWFSAKKGQLGERRIFIHSVFVDEKSRRQGIAADLLDKLANDYFGSQISPGGLTKDGKPFWDWWSSSRGLAELSDPQFPNSRHLMTDEQLEAQSAGKNVDGSNFPYDVISIASDSPVKAVEESEVNAVDINPQWQVMPANKSTEELDLQFEDYYRESKFSIDRFYNEDVTDEQERASSGMMAYQANDYFLINGLLRNQITVEEDAYGEDAIDPVEYKATVKQIYSMDMLYENAPTIPEDMVLYRGLHSDYSDKLMRSYEVGDLFSDTAYSSTTIDLTTAQGWSSSHDADYVPSSPGGKAPGLVLEIVAPAGTRGIYLPTYLGGGVDHSDEFEVLLDRGTTFRVIAKTEDADGIIRVMRVAVVDQTKEPIDPNAPSSAPEKETEAPEAAEAPTAPEPTVTIKGKVTETGMPKITVNEPLSFDYTAYKDIPSLTSAIASLSDENIQFAKLRGSSALFDSGDVEDLEVRVEGIVDEQGNEKMRITYKLTSWAGDNLVKSMETEGEWDDKDGIEIPTTAVDPKTGAILIKTSVYSQYRGVGTTYTADLGNATVTLRRSADFEKSSALNNYVTIDLPYDASDDDIKSAMEVGGITDVRPSTTTDFAVLAENRLMSIFGGRTDATKNLKQAAAREKVLTDIESAYGVTPADVFVTVGPGGQLETRIPDAVAQKITEKTGAKYLIHDFSMGGLMNMEAVNRGIEDVQMLNLDQRKELLVGGIIDFLTGPRGGGLMATRTRWFNGIPLTGMSSDSDVGTGGADYVFFTPEDKVGKRHISGVYGNSEAELMFDAAKLYTRLDWYANFVDDYGRRSPRNNLIKSATVGAYEVMFKKRVGLESLQSMAVHRDLRDDILIELDKRGIKEIQGRPVNEVVVVAGAPEDATSTSSTAYVPLTALIKDLSNKMLMEKLSYGEQQKYLNNTLEYEYAYPPASSIQVLAAKQDFSSLLTKDTNTGIYWYYHADGTRTLVKVEEVQGLVDSLGKEGSDLKVFKQTGFYSMEPVKEALAKYKSGEITAEQFANVILAAQWGPNSWGVLVELNAILKSNPEVWDLFKKIVKGSK